MLFLCLTNLSVENKQPTQHSLENYDMLVLSRGKELVCTELAGCKYPCGNQAPLPGHGSRK